MLICGRQLLHDTGTSDTIVNGRDLVIHSATKYLDGQGRVLGGAVLGPAELVEPVTTFIRSGGVTISAFNAGYS